MFEKPLHPTSFGMVVGVLVMALWALLWTWFFAQLTAAHAHRTLVAQVADYVASNTCGIG